VTVPYGLDLSNLAIGQIVGGSYPLVVACGKCGLPSVRIKTRWRKGCPYHVWAHRLELREVEKWFMGGGCKRWIKPYWVRTHSVQKMEGDDG